MVNTSLAGTLHNKQSPGYSHITSTRTSQTWVETKTDKTDMQRHRCATHRNFYSCDDGNNHERAIEDDKLVD